MSVIVTFKKNIQLYYDLALAALILVLPLSTAIPNILLGIFLALFLCRLFFGEILRVGRDLIPIMLSFLVLLILSVLKGGFVEDNNFYLKLCIAVSMMIAVPYVQNKKWMENALLIGVFLAITGSLFRFFMVSGSDHSVVFGNTAMVNEILYLERPYFGFLLVLCVFFGLKNRGWLYKIAAVLAAAYCFFIAARLGMLLIALTGCVFLNKKLKLRALYKNLIVVATLLILVLLALANPNLRQRFQIGEDVKTSLDRALDYEPRYVIWPCAANLLTDAKTAFIGLRDNGEAESELVACYDVSNVDNLSKKSYYQTEKFNTHNQFLNLFIFGGFLPFALFLFAFIKVWSLPKAKFDLKFMFFLLFVFLLFENLLVRQLGLYIFGIFTALYVPNTFRFSAAKDKKR